MEGEGKNSSKQWVAKALRSTSGIFKVLKDGNIPLVGIIECALKGGASMLHAETSNEDLHGTIQNSFSMITKDIKNIEEEVSKIKSIVGDIRYLDGIEKVDAAYQSFINGSQNMAQTLTDLQSYVFELDTNAKQSLSPTKINSYFNHIKTANEFSFQSFQTTYAYVIATKAKFLFMMTIYYFFKNNSNRVGEEFERFNAEINEIFGIYQTICAEKWIEASEKGLL